MNHQIRVLLADADRAYLDQISAMLCLQRILPYHYKIVARCRTGREVIALAHQHSPDITLIDLDLPGGDGIETALALRRQTQASRILLLSAHYGRLDIFTALAADIRGFVLKCAPLSLLTALGAVHAGGIWFDPAVIDQMRRCSGQTQAGVRWERPLTPRELQVMESFRQGLSRTGIATELQMGVETVKTHLERIRNKAGCATLSELRLKLGQFVLS